jgi:hypothetical protein
MEQIIERIISGFPALFGSFPEYREQFEQFVAQHVGAVPLPLIYLFCTVVVVLLVYSVLRFMLRLALFVIVPTVGSALAISYAFPALEAAKVMPVAGIFFIILFVFKH